jgi:hypothetical protein
MGPTERQTKQLITDTYGLSAVGQRLQAGDAASVNSAPDEDTWNFIFGVIGGYRVVIEGLAAEIDHLAERIAALEGH